MATCALCLREQTLKQSHILPKFAQRRMKLLAKAGDGPVLSHCAGSERPVQNFCFEALICGDCEQRFSRWERVAADFLRKREFDPSGLVSGNTTVLTQLSYRELKLFLLSLLWRMGVSDLREFVFVKLGPHEAIIRDMILREDPGTTETYGCSLQVLTDRTGRIPLTRGADYHRADQFGMLYRLILDGFLFIWQVGRPEAVARSSTREWLLRDDGTCQVLFQDRRRVPFVSHALRPLFQRPAAEPSP
jgi:hypothetical protein